MLFAALFITSSLWAQIPSGYYDGAEGKTGQELRAALHEIIKEHHSVGYGGLLDAYPYTDHDGNGHVWDIYSSCTFTYGVTSQECGSYKKEGDCWNREHSWPQSWFNEQSTPRCDLFHVYPTDGKVNGIRSNFPYAIVKNPTYTSSNGSKLGTSITSGYSGTAFEPIDEYKGDIARSFFYMSTRYYNEDSGWTSSEMTNKCEIKSWAMTMLLDWHKQDPVSQKEIDRNNVIYASYQHNRNPFIDHPEYAEMIWDENWQAGTSYNITSATNLSGGTVSAPYSAIEGTTVAITATPNAGYKVMGYSAWKTGDTSTQVTVSSNGTFTMPGYPVTVSATFERDNTQYAITLSNTTNGIISASATSALSGTEITLTPTPADGYVLHAIHVYKTSDINTTVAVDNNKFVMPSFNVTVSATFVEEGSAGGTGDFVKVTSEPQDWSGEYLIVCESYNVAFNGTVENDWGRCSGVTISSNTIEANATTNGFVVTISPNGSGYKILLPSGKYMSWTTRDFSEDTSPTTYSISLSGGNVNISKGGYTLQYNHNGGNGGLRSYTSSSMSSIQLYKRSAPPAPAVMHTITFLNNDGNSYTQEVEEFVPTALIPNTFTLEGYEFDGWQDNNGTFYADCAMVTLLYDITLYPLWNELFDITLVQPAHGTISASATTASEDTDIELTATPDEGYLFHHWTVTNAAGETVQVFDSTFEMPKSNVTVTATFVKDTSSNGDFVKVTSEPTDWSGEYLIVYESGNIAFNGGLTKLDAVNDFISVTIADNKIAATDATNAATFTIAPMTGGYSIKAKSGLYVGWDSDTSNGLSSQAVALKNTLSYNSDGIDIRGSAGAYLRYNNDDKRFRYYKSASYTNQQAIQLYKRTSVSFILGDINFDDAVTIADVTALVNIILGKDDEEPHLYNHEAADVNDDGTITIADVTALVNIILGKTF